VSNFVDISAILAWYDKARFATIGKNSVRKELLQNFQGCFVPMIQVEPQIAATYLFQLESGLIRRIVDFLNIDGKAQNLSDDQRLQYSTAVEELGNKLKNFIRSRERLAPALISSHCPIPIECSYSSVPATSSSRVHVSAVPSAAGSTNVSPQPHTDTTVQTPPVVRASYTHVNQPEVASSSAASSTSQTQIHDDDQSHLKFQ